MTWRVTVKEEKPKPPKLPCIFGFEPWCSEDNPPIFRPFKPPECKEGETKCEGYDLYVCENGKWVLKERNSPQCGYTPPPSRKNITFNVINKSEWYVGIAQIDGNKITQAKVVKSGNVTFNFPNPGEPLYDSYLFNFYLIPTPDTPLSSDYLIHTDFYKTGNTYTFEVPPTDVIIQLQPRLIAGRLFCNVYIDGKNYGVPYQVKLYAGTHSWKVVILPRFGEHVTVSYKDKPLERGGTFNVGSKSLLCNFRIVDEGTGALILNTRLHGMIKVQFGDKTYTFDNGYTSGFRYGRLHIIDIPEGVYNLKVFQNENLVLDKNITIVKDKNVDMSNYTYGEKAEFMVV